MCRLSDKSVLPLQTGTMTLLRVTLTLTLLATMALGQDSCQMHSMRQNIVYHYNGMYCEKTIDLNKCEGQCESNVTPSVLNHQGFRQTCRCCKEGSTLEEQVTLPDCFDGQGNRVNQQLRVAVTKILSCNCTECV